MNLQLSGRAGTGNEILKNWNMFNYVFDKSKYSELCNDSCYNIYPFYVRFADREGYINIVLEDGIVSQCTVLDCGFKRPLSASSDCARYEGGLYDVALKLITSLKWQL